MSNIKKLRKEMVGKTITIYFDPTTNEDLEGDAEIINIQAVGVESEKSLAYGDVEFDNGDVAYRSWVVEPEPHKPLESLGDHHPGSDAEGGKNHRIESKIIKSEADLDQFLKEEQLDFTVEKYQEKNPFTHEERNSWGSYRTDNNHVFATGLGATFTPFQNRDAFQAIADLSQVGEVKTARAGVWNGGAETFVQVDLNGGLQVGGGDDTVTQRISYINRNDGEGSARIFLTPYRPNCRNQLTMIRSTAKKAEQLLKIRHTQSGEALLMKLSEEWGIIDNAFKATQEHFNVMADTKITKEHIA